MQIYFGGTQKLQSFLFKCQTAYLYYEEQFITKEVGNWLYNDERKAETHIFQVKQTLTEAIVSAFVGISSLDRKRMVYSRTVSLNFWLNVWRG